MSVYESCEWADSYTSEDDVTLKKEIAKHEWNIRINVLKFIKHPGSLPRSWDDLKKFSENCHQETLAYMSAALGVLASYKTNAQIKGMMQVFYTEPFDDGLDKDCKDCWLPLECH